jgi:hypothetical protein
MKIFSLRSEPIDTSVSKCVLFGLLFVKGVTLKTKMAILFILFTFFCFGVLELTGVFCISNLLGITDPFLEIAPKVTAKPSLILEDSKVLPLLEQYNLRVVRESSITESEQKVMAFSIFSVAGLLAVLPFFACIVYECSQGGGFPA